MKMSTKAKGQPPLRRRRHSVARAATVATLAVLGGSLAPAASYAASGTAPTITSAPSAQVRPGYGLYFTITTTGSPTPVVTESGPLPPGLGFQAIPNGTAVIQGITPASASGSYTVTITASNGVAPDAVQQLVISFVTTTTHDDAVGVA